MIRIFNLFSTNEAGISKGKVIGVKVNIMLSMSRQIYEIWRLFLTKRKKREKHD